ncbi:MAG: hypothetical protein E6R06_26135 [Mycobacterium sp.]|nr:MAG: hypothetical protein E6R06_26135 [Mycobacterium sp.]
MLATLTDLQARLGRTLTDDEQPYATALLEESTAAVTAWCGQDFTDPITGLPDIPTAVTIATSRIAARALASTAEPGVTTVSTTMGPFQNGRSYAATGIWIGKQDKMLLRAHRNIHAENTTTSYRPPTP